MSRQRQFPVDIEVALYGVRRGVVLDFGAQPIGEWALELCLLDNELVDSLRLVDARQRLSVSIRRDCTVISPDRARLDWKADFIDLGLSRTEIQYWVSFFLKYYRDGVASVDHIDLDIPGPGRNGDAGNFVTLRVARSEPPVSGDVAKRRLGL